MKAMLKQKPAINPNLAEQVARTLGAAEEYLMLKEQSEEIAKKMKSLRVFLEPELAESPDESIQIGDQVLKLVFCEKEKFDLEAAKKQRGLAPKLKPYTIVSESLDLKSAKKHIDEAKLEPFITRSPYTMLKVGKAKKDK